MLLRFAPLLCLGVSLLGYNLTADEVRTVNIDFGNGGAYVGDDGILSSPGGTYWNEAVVTPGGVNPDYVRFRPLLDEFGQPFDDLGWGPEVNTDAVRGGTAGGGEGPLNDAVRLESDFYDTLVVTPMIGLVDLVVYFRTSSSLGPTPYGSRGEIVGEVVDPTGTFPGVLGRDFLYFEQIPFNFATPNVPPITGIAFGPINLFGPTSAEIAAVQIRGVFRGVPEPSSLAALMMIFATLGGSRGTLRRRM